MANSNTTQSVAVGEVRSIQGEVFAKSADGNMRRLAAGDQIFEGEVIITANGSSAEINIFNGPVLNVAEQQSVTIDSQVISPAHDATAGAVSDLGSTEAAKVVQTVSADDQQDFNVLLEEEAAAAGLTGGDGGGSSFVDLVRIVENVPTTGYDFPINPTGTPPVIEGQAGVPPVAAEIPIVVSLASVLGILPSGEVDGILEGGSVIFTVTLSQASGGDVTVTLSNGAEITIPAGTLSGSSQPVAVQSDDPYVDPSEHSVSIVGMTGGGANEVLSFDDTPVGYTVADTTDTTTVSLTATPSITEAGTSITYMATLTNAAGTGSPVTVALSNGETITIAGGASSGSVVHAVTADEDVYIDPTTVSATISSASGGNFENLVVDSTAAVTSITDTIDATTVTLSNTTVNERGDYTITATVDNKPETNLVLNLSNGATVTILAGQTTGTSTPAPAPNVDNDGGQITVSVASHSGGNYELLNTGTALVTIIDSTPTAPVDDSITVEEESIPGIGGNNENEGYSYTISGTFADNANWGGDGFGGIVSVNGVSTVDANGKITASDAAGTLVVTATGDNAGAYTYTLNHNLLQAGADENTQTAPSFAIVGKDADGSTIGFNLNVSVIDDVPTFTQIMQGIVANQSGVLSGTHNIAFGADGEGSINLSGLTTVAGLNYSTATHNSDGSTTITAGTGASTTGFFSLTIKADGTYDFNLIDSRPSIDKVVAFPNIQGGAGVPVLTVGTGADAITFTGLDGDTIKPTSAGFGINDGNLNPGDDFNIAFAGNQVDSVSFAVKHQGSDAFTMNWVTNTGETGTVSTLVDATMKVDPLNDFTSITFNTTDGNAKMDTFSYSQNLLPPDQVLQFGVSATDADGDVTGTQVLGIQLLGGAIGAPISGTSADESILGTSASETINGGAGDDVLIGGAGDDVMTGGSGADTFVFRLADAPVGVTTIDKVTDFSTSDTLDLSDLVTQGASIYISDYDPNTNAVTVTATFDTHIQEIQVAFDATVINHNLIDDNGVVKIG